MVVDVVTVTNVPVEVTAKAAPTVWTPLGAPGHVITCPEVGAVPEVTVRVQPEEHAKVPTNVVDFLQSSRPIRPSPVSGSTEYELMTLSVGLVKVELI